VSNDARTPVYRGDDVEIDNTLVRMPSNVKQAAKAAAKAAGVSANQFFVDAIATALGMHKETITKQVVVGYRWRNGKPRGENPAVTGLSPENGADSLERHQPAPAPTPSPGPTEREAGT